LTLASRKSLEKNIHLVVLWRVRWW